MASKLDGQIDLIRQRIGEGKNNTEIAGELETSEAAIRRARRRHSLEPSTATSALDFQGQSLPYIKSKKIEWGNGRAQLVDRAGGRDGEIVVSISDVHVPYQDTPVVAAALNMIADIQPDTVILNGDVADLFEISSHCRSPERWDQLQNDLDLTNHFLYLVGEAAGNARKFATEGNHENRLRSYLKLNAPKLMSLRTSALEAQIAYAENDFTFFAGEQGFLLRPEFLVQHGNLIRSETGASARAHLVKHGISGISGHTHRLGTYRRTGYVQREWVEQGGLMRTDADYVEAPNWQQGCVVLEFSNRTGNFVSHEVPYVDGSLRLGLQRYSGEQA